MAYFLVLYCYNDKVLCTQFFTCCAKGRKPMQDRWLSVDDICDYLGVKRDTIYKWINEKSMPAHRVGRLWKFKKEQVDAWVEAGGASDKSDKSDPK
jgi:excisionase family DNA binding protein